LGVKIFGIGGGTTMTQMFGFDDNIETTVNCLRLDVFVTLDGKRYLKKDSGNKQYFWRYDVSKIENDWKISAIIDSNDKCNLSPNHLESLKWQYKTFQVPVGVTWTKSLESARSQSVEISTSLQLFDMEIGPRVVVDTLRNIKYSYTLAGPKTYFAYYPINSNTYCWTATD